MTSLGHSLKDGHIEPKPYKYKSLQKHASRFRLFKLQPSGADPSIICGYLLEYSLDNHPVYESLSYVWGQKNKDKTILLDETSLKVTESLQTALSHLRLPDKQRTLWIDQICINQEDHDERSHQVLQMSKIYKEAISNIAWLGEPDEDTPIAFDLAKRLINKSTFSDIRKHIERWNASQIRAMYGRVFTSPPSTVELHDLDITQLTSQESEALIATFRRRSIWSRIWIIQEFIFAAHMILQCGHHTLDWDAIDFIMVFHICRTGFVDKYHSTVTIALAIAFKNPLFLLNLRISLLRGRLLPWTEILALTGGWEATDDKDRIYALLAISENIGIIPNYTKSVRLRDTFIVTAVAILKYNKNLDILCRQQPYEPSNGLQQIATELPSWVPQFRTEATEIYMTYVRYDASRGCPKFDFECSESLGTLSVHGKHVDYVHITFGQRVASGGQKFPIWHDCLHYRAPWLILRLLQRSLSPSESPDALWYTMIMEHGWNNGVPDLLRKNEVFAYKREYQQWLSSIMASTNENPPVPLLDTSFMKIAMCMLRDRFITVTRQGRFASVPWDTKTEDEICIPYGTKMPLVVRRDVRTGFYKVVGVAYIYGLMKGEAFQSASLLPSRKYTFQ